MKSPETVKAEALALIRQAGDRGIHEGQILNAIFPPPAYPGKEAGTDAIDAWKAEHDEWAFKAYGGSKASDPDRQIEYRDTFAGICSGATVELTKAGLIHEHNNGYASYSFTPIYANRN